MNHGLYFLIALTIVGRASLRVATLRIHALHAALGDDLLLVDLRWVDLITQRVILEELLLCMRLRKPTVRFGVDRLALHHSHDLDAVLGISVR